MLLQLLRGKLLLLLLMLLLLLLFGHPRLRARCPKLRPVETIVRAWGGDPGLRALRARRPRLGRNLCSVMWCARLWVEASARRSRGETSAHARCGAGSRA